MSEPIRVLIVDDHPVVRSGLRSMLEGEPGITVVGEADDGTTAIELVAQLRPRVVLMDLRMPRVDGVAATAAICRSGAATNVIILTTYDTDADILGAVEAGAIGYLMKDAPRAELLGAIRAAAEGRSVLAPKVATRLVERAGPQRATQPRLTPREIQVLALVAVGETNQAIARHLRVSEATVKTHLVNVFEKLDVDDRTAAVTAAISRGILRLDD